MYQCDVTDNLDSLTFSEVMEVRRAVYVEEMDYPEEFILDWRDAASIHVILKSGQMPVGSVRLTLSEFCPLEMESQNQDWTELALRLRTEGKRICELTRLMVKPEARNGSALIELLLAAGKVALERSQDFMFAAGKSGKHTRLYQMLGAVVMDPEFRDYKIAEHSLGKYNLLAILRENAEEYIRRLERHFYVGA